jgi:hypothetical protein
MLQLDGRALTFGCIGAVIGAAIVGAAWGIVSRQPEPEPASRRSAAYDYCLATGRGKTACDALMRVLAADREKARRDYEQACLAEAKYPDNPFVKLDCAAPQ